MSGNVWIRPDTGRYHPVNQQTVLHAGVVFFAMTKTKTIFARKVEKTGKDVEKTGKNSRVRMSFHHLNAIFIIAVTSFRPITDLNSN